MFDDVPSGADPRPRGMRISPRLHPATDRNIKIARPGWISCGSERMDTVNHRYRHYYGHLMRRKVWRCVIITGAVRKESVPALVTVLPLFLPLSVTFDTAEILDIVLCFGNLRLRFRYLLQADRTIDHFVIMFFVIHNDARHL